ncbi:hypothetical protein LMH87_003077 [Akanthomyces muscarius]|uniref:Zn(2)-C6 fungal-type domain-containing protein n=1 Tax=Akanthomyces muscarius TaxID=2231603 RepID=A0A9W8UJ68_AKAMU|nr:hypothetical protein LMH87_003077 [Akanthomyces muscarius]KAJ4148615.1 hypothetical protein LMH87_003077 [Akanthomyces muscarius]
MVAATPSRQRKWAPHVRTGCDSCLIPHVKCDEEKLCCRRCRVKGMQCRGLVYGESAESAKTKNFDPSDCELVEAARYYLEASASYNETSPALAVRNYSTLLTGEYSLCQHVVFMCMDLHVIKSNNVASEDSIRRDPRRMPWPSLETGRVVQFHRTQ